MFRAGKPVIDCLARLQRACAYAAEVGCDPWRFAVEWRILKSLGMEPTDARWLIARGFVEVRREISVPNAFERVFVRHDVPRLSHDAAFVLTPAGEAFCRCLDELSESSEPECETSAPHFNQSVPEPLPQSSPQHTKIIPHWDPDRRELAFDGQIVKRYRVPSPNQELILRVFQEESWPQFIDDPLPPQPNIDPITRLQATVKSLNRSQMNKVIRFHGNGGRKVFWEPAPPVVPTV
jgi:hypothetical protein